MSTAGSDRQKDPKPPLGVGGLLSSDFTNRQTRKAMTEKQIGIEGLESPEEAMIVDRAETIKCRCCGHHQKPSSDLHWGFYCHQCGQYWKFSVSTYPLPKLRQPDNHKLPWDD